MWYFEQRSAMRAAKKLFKSYLKAGVPKKLDKDLGMFKVMDKPWHDKPYSSLSFMAKGYHTYNFAVKYRREGAMEFTIRGYDFNLPSPCPAIGNIKANYPTCRVNFDKDWVLITFEEKNLESVKDFKENLKSFISLWNDTDLFKLVEDLRKIQAL